MAEGGCAQAGALYVVATPIGNLEDLSPRARRILAEATMVAAEDTRHSGRLLRHFGIAARLVSLHEHNEAQAVPALVARLRQGQTVALVSDAGTPLVSDPGFELVRAVHRAGLPVLAVPGPSAALAALCVSGLPTDRFVFEGFLPARGGPRRARLQALAGETRTMVFFEAPHRVHACLRDLCQAFGQQRPAALAREITKLHEETVCASLGEILAWLDQRDGRQRGEFVLVVGGGAGAERGPSLDLDRLLRALVQELGVKGAARVAAQATGEPRNRLYERALRLTSGP